MVIGIEIGDGELHKLQYDIFSAFFWLELVLNIFPSFVITISHEI